MRQISLLFTILAALFAPGVLSAYNVNFDIPHDNAITLTDPQTHEVISLVKGVNQVEVTPAGAFLVKANAGYILSKITAPDGSVIAVYNNSTYVYFRSEEECAGKTWSVAVAPESEYYSGKFRLWVDRPEKVNFSIGINRSITNLVSGWNDVFFAPADEKYINIYPVNIMDEIVAIEQDGVSITPDPNYNQLPLKEGTEIKVTTIYPEGKAKLKISFATPGCESFISNLSVNGVTIPSKLYLQDDYEVSIGTNLIFTFNMDEYKSDGTCTINGDQINHGSAMQYRVLKDTEIIFDPEHYRTLTKNINVVGGASNISVTYRAMPVELHDGDNVFSFQENFTTLNIIANPGWRLASVTQGGEDVELWFGAMTLTEEGDLKIVVEEDIPDVEYVLYIDETVNLQDHMFMMANAAGYPVEVSAGYSHVKGFTRDLPLSFFWFITEGKSELYVNDEIAEIAESGGVYSFQQPINDGDVIRIYIKETPARNTVTFDNTSTVGVSAVRDYVKAFEPSGKIEVFPATLMEFNAPEGKKFKIGIDGQPLEEVSYKAVTVNATTHITLTDAEQDGIVDIETGAVNATIYNLQGIIVGTGDDFDRLPAGIYIVNGKKVIKH